MPGPEPMLAAEFEPARAMGQWMERPPRKNAL